MANQVPGQESFFQPTPDESLPPIKDIAEIARHIAEHAPVDPYAATSERRAAIVETRGEDIAGEQTGVPTVDTVNEGEQTVRRHTRESRQRLYELPGKLGRSNTPPLPRPKDVQRGLTDGEIDARNADIRRHTSVIRRHLYGSND